MSRHGQQQQTSYHDDGDELQQHGFSPSAQQIGQVSTGFSTLFQEPAKRAAKSLPKPKAKKNGSARHKHDKYSDPEAWRAGRAERIAKRIAAKRALRKEQNPEPEKHTEDEALEVTLTTPRPRREKVKPKEATASKYPLNAREIAQHDKKRTEREEAERARIEAEAKAERDKHNARADDMRAAFERGEYHIERLEAQLENSILTQKREIDYGRAHLEQQIAAHHAEHALSHGVMSDEERAAHNLETEYLRSAVTRHIIRLDFLTADAKPNDSHMQRLIRSEQSKLRLARRTLAEHIAQSVQSERLLDELTDKPDLLLTNLEAELVRSTRSQEREIARQRQKLVQIRRELPEYICDAVKQERLLAELQKEVAAQAAKVEEFNQPNLEAEKNDAQRVLTRLQRQLSALQEKLEKAPPATNDRTSSLTKPLQQKPKETKLDRLWREALDAAKAARDARNNARKAERSGDPLRAHLDRKATQLKDIAATKAEKYRKEEARVNPPAAKKVATKPKPKPRAKPPASAPEQPATAAPVVKSTTSIAEPATEPAARKADTSANPAAKPARIRYPKKQPVPPRPITPEVIAMILADPKKPVATTKKGRLKPKAEEPVTPPAAAPEAVATTKTDDVAKASPAFPPEAPAKPEIEPAASALPANTNAKDLTSQLAAARKAADIAIIKGNPDAVELLRAANVLAAQLEQSAPQSAPKPAAAPAPNTLAQQVLDILNGRNDTPAESGFAAREVAKRQAEARAASEAQAAAAAAAERKAAEAAAAAEEARLEGIRLEVVARHRAARAAAAAGEPAGITRPSVEPTAVDPHDMRLAKRESLDELANQLGFGKIVDPLNDFLLRQRAAREAAAKADPETYQQWLAQEAERRVKLARTKGR